MQYIPPDVLPAVWDEAERLLLTVVDRGAEWTPAHVRAACEAQRAALFLAPGSVLVAVPRECEFTGAREFYVWCAAGSYHRHIGWLLSHAKEKGFARVGFDSPRKGWGRRFKEGHRYYYAEV